MRSTSRSACRSSAPRPITAPRSTSPARTAPIRARWRRRSGWPPTMRSPARRRRLSRHARAAARGHCAARPQREQGARAELHPRPAAARARSPRSRAISTGERVYEVGPGPGRADPRAARRRRVGRRGRARPPLHSGAGRAAERVRRTGSRSSKADALKIDEQRAVGDRRARRRQPALQCRHRAAAQMARRRLAAVVAIADLDVPEGGRRAHRRRSRAATPTAACRSPRSGARARGSR